MEQVFSRPVFWLGVVIVCAWTRAAIYFVRRTVAYRGRYQKLRAILLCLPTAQPLLLVGVDRVPPVIVFGLVLGMLVTILMTSFVQDGRKDRDRGIRDAAFRADYKAR